MKLLVSTSKLGSDSNDVTVQELVNRGAYKTALAHLERRLKKSKDNYTKAKLQVGVPLIPHRYFAQATYR